MTFLWCDKCRIIFGCFNGHVKMNDCRTCKFAACGMRHSTMDPLHAEAFGARAGKCTPCLSEYKFELAVSSN